MKLKNIPDDEIVEVILRLVNNADDENISWIPPREWMYEYVTPSWQVDIAKSCAKTIKNRVDIHLTVPTTLGAGAGIKRRRDVSPGVCDDDDQSRHVVKRQRVTNDNALHARDPAPKAKPRPKKKKAPAKHSTPIQVSDSEDAGAPIEDSDSVFEDSDEELSSDDDGPIIVSTKLPERVEQDLPVKVSEVEDLLMKKYRVNDEDAKTIWWPIRAPAALVETLGELEIDFRCKGNHADGKKTERCSTAQDLSVHMGKAHPSVDRVVGIDNDNTRMTNTLERH
ncbi:uncharacterized protein AB675_5312 [Cyphellophora attinorum]|uniref:Uncharacterized protein n=1 Tax=Cyphellophora attinorum TaxID=1664694 RepID=A0A0N1HCI1_9EURO|nr:uncharacterized protein AB675_5312 [Phialophora attinorum]KPI42066.1 hypothetical protein AB675_5312 [Phialophora attinorum]